MGEYAPGEDKSWGSSATPFPDPWADPKKVDPPKGSIIYTMGILDCRIEGSLFWILPTVWFWSCSQERAAIGVLGIQKRGFYFLDLPSLGDRLT